MAWRWEESGHSNYSAELLSVVPGGGSLGFGARVAIVVVAIVEFGRGG